MADNGIIFGSGDCTLSIANPFNSQTIVLTLRNEANWYRGLGYQRRKIPQTQSTLSSFRQPVNTRVVAGGREKHTFRFDLLLSDDEKLTLMEIFAAYEEQEDAQVQWADNRNLYTEVGNINTRALASASVEVRPNGYVRYFAQFNIRFLDVQALHPIDENTLLGNATPVFLSTGSDSGARAPLWRASFTAIEGTKIAA